MTMSVLHMELLGERLRIEAPSPGMLEGVRRAAILFNTSDDTDRADLIFRFQALERDSDPILPAGTPRAVSEQKDFEVFSEGDDLTVVVEGKSVARCRMAEGTVDVSIHAAHLDNWWVIGHRLFFIPLLEWMRLRGWYPLHGSCFQVDGRTIVVCGPSGSGKSTAALSALAAGCPIMSDDTLFARRGGTAIFLDAFPEPIKIGKGSARFFPEWSDRFSKGVGKLILAEDQLPGKGRVSGAIPDFLLFPVIQKDGETSICPMSKEEALIRLLPQSVLPAGPDLIQRHLDLLGELVEKTETYSLQFGRDARALPDRIRSIF